jgi:disulfide bond formation protein DsbB
MIERGMSLARGQPAGTAAVAIAAIGLAAILGAYFVQYVVGLPPCPLCLEQRYAYYVSIPLAAMILLGASVGSSRKVLMLALFAIAAAMLWNAALGVYHSGVEWRWWPGPQDCSGAIPNFSIGGRVAISGCSCASPPRNPQINLVLAPPPPCTIRGKPVPPGG